jgi:transcriptional regulator with PAS, ATPase and Fis domain
VLIRGESGTGKELVARALHESGPRVSHRFVAINCAALPENLLEAEFFGVEKGAATGVAARKGRFETADNGTVFLDEIGDMSPALQAKLLRVLQEKCFERVGGREMITVDVRVVAATNQNLGDLMLRGLFRKDLYYRLNTVELELPPLRERKEDIAELVRHFIARSNHEFGRSVADAGPEVMARFRAHPWPGNIRELQHAVERAVLLTRGSVLQVADLPPEFQVTLESAAPTTGLRAAKRDAQAKAGAEVERTRVQECLDQACWNVSEAAKLAGYSRAQFYRLITKHGITRPRE